MTVLGLTIAMMSYWVMQIGEFQSEQELALFLKERKVQTQKFTEKIFPDLDHYVSTSKSVQTTYPSWYDPNIFSSGRIQDWIQVLPEESRTAKKYLVIKRLGMIVPIHESQSEVSFFKKDSKNLLEQGALQHPLDRNYGTIIAGHTSDLVKNDGNFKTIFQGLALVQTGDMLTIYTKTSTSRWLKKNYTYTQKIIVDPAQTDILNSTQKDDLVLYGCYPFGSLEKRIVVQAKRV